MKKLFALLVMFFVLIGNVYADSLRIDKVEIVKLDEHNVRIMASTSGYDHVGITIRVGVILPDNHYLPGIKELGVAAFNEVDAPTFDFSNREDGIYVFVVEAKHGTSWTNRVTVFAYYEYKH